MSRYIIPPKFDFLTQLKKFGSKRFRPFAMYFFEFEHEFSQKDLGNIWQNIQPNIATSFEKEKVSVCHSLNRSELLTIKDLKNPDLHWMVFKVKQKAKWNYFDKVIDLAGQLPPNPDAGTRLLSQQLGNETQAPPESADSVCPEGSAPDYCGMCDGMNTEAHHPDCPEKSSPGMPTHAGGVGISGLVATPALGADIARAIQYARQESDVASGYGLDYSYNWPYDFCSLVELIKIDTEVHLGGGDSIQITPTIGPDGKEETVVVSGTGAKRVVSDETREEAPGSAVARALTNVQSTASPPPPTAAEKRACMQNGGTLEYDATLGAYVCKPGGLLQETLNLVG